MNQTNSFPRFTVDDPPNPDCPAYINWQVYDDGRRISVDQLARIANRLERHVAQLLAERATPVNSDQSPVTSEATLKPIYQ